MRYVADLHIHSYLSRACSRELRPEALYRWCQLKGIALLSCGDFTHPAWFSELREKLEPAESGLFQLKAELRRKMDPEVPLSCRSPVRFILGVEISCIYKKGGRVRKVHHLAFAPSFEAAGRLSVALEKIGNIRSDGRPILGLDSRRLLEIVLEAGEGCCLIPAHVWTPHFALFGSESGFDALEECFEDLSPHIFALETGLSSDPSMNWRLARHDRLTLISNSDAHSPEKLGREANVIEGELSYAGLFDALRRRRGRLAETIEFFPEEGKYHVDGHRKCGIRLRPQQTLKRKGLCPSCGKPVTVGVLSRIEKLADRPEGERPPGAAGFQRLIPLKEVLGQCLRVGPGSVKVDRLYHRLLALFGSELHILRELALPKLEALSGAEGPALGLALARMRRGEVAIAPGYDGEYGTIALLDQGDLDRSRQKAQLALL